MKLYIKQKIFSWGDRFSIYDRDGNERYTVQGEVFSFGKKLHLYDRFGVEQAFIRQQLLRFRPTYTVERHGTVFAEVVQRFTFFRQSYYISGPDWTVEGNLWNHEYRIYSGKTPIVSVFKKWFTLGDAYEIDIDPCIDEIAALATVLVIDACIEAQNNN